MAARKYMDATTVANEVIEAIGAERRAGDHAVRAYDAKFEAETCWNANPTDATLLRTKWFTAEDKHARDAWKRSQKALLASYRRAVRVLAKEVV